MNVQIVRKLWMCSVMLLTLSASAVAQDSTGQGLAVDVEQGGLVLFQMAVPDAISLDGAPDTLGVTEALMGTVTRDLKISGFFNLLDRAAFLTDPAAEGMTPKYRDWFNIGTQGLIKVGYRITGDKALVDMRLYSVDSSERVTLNAPYDGPVELPVNPARLRAHAHGFVNEVIRFFTKEPGVFGSQIVVVKRVGRGKELYMVSSDGLDEVRLTKTKGINMLPSIGAGRIYFTSFRNGGAHLFSLSGGKSRPFASYKGLNTGAVLSPSGEFVAATLSKDGNPEIYLLHPDTGKVLKRLTRSWGIDTSPAWSPDGKKIAFVSNRHGSPQLWVMNADGSDPKRLTFQGDYNQTPDWNPKGDLIAFTARDERAVFDIFTVSVNDGAVTRLTQNQGNNEEPTWSPDGRFLAFTSTRNGKPKLYVMDKTGRYQTQISTGKGAYLTPCWAR